MGINAFTKTGNTVTFLATEANGIAVTVTNGSQWVVV